VVADKVDRYKATLRAIGLGDETFALPLSSLRVVERTNLFMSLRCCVHCSSRSVSGEILSCGNAIPVPYILLIESSPEHRGVRCSENVEKRCICSSHCASRPTQLSRSAMNPSIDVIM
jgi:hypothetical protein